VLIVCAMSLSLVGRAAAAAHDSAEQQAAAMTKTLWLTWKNGVRLCMQRDPKCQEMMVSVLEGLRASPSTSLKPVSFGARPEIPAAPYFLLLRDKLNRGACDKAALLELADAATRELSDQNHPIEARELQALRQRIEQCPARP
jgi:hypothetical protein